MKIKLGREYKNFLIYLVVVIILTPFMMDLITRSWNTELMRSITAGIKTIDPNGVSILMSIVAGFYAGSILLLFADRYKKIQAVLLSIGMLVMFNYMTNKFNINWNIIFIGIGVLIGIVIGYGSKAEEKEFGNATTSLSIFSILYIMISFLILYASPDQSGNSFIKDAIVMLAFAYFFGKLVGYVDPGPKIFVLGPASAGKTMFLVGCYLEALRVTEIPARASQDLRDAVDEFHEGSYAWLTRTGKIQEYQFTYEVGKLFPKKTVLRALDYPGVFLENISRYMYIKKDKAKMNETEKRYITVADEIIDADSLIFIIDGEKFPQFGNMGIAYYIDILSKLNEHGKKIKPYIVFTKSDLLMTQYVDKGGNKEDYEGFKKFIQEISSKNIYMVQLLNESSKASFYPVFYYTKKEGTDYIPMRDDDKNVYIFGFDKFIDSLSEI